MSTEIQETDNRGESQNLDEVKKPPECLWVKLLFDILKTIIIERNRKQNLSITEIRDLHELTKKIIKLSKNISKRGTTPCGLRYKYIMGAAQILKLSSNDFPERKDLFCEILMC